VLGRNTKSICFSKVARFNILNGNLDINQTWIALCNLGILQEYFFLYVWLFNLIYCRYQGKEVEIQLWEGWHQVGVSFEFFYFYIVWNSKWVILRRLIEKKLGKIKELHCSLLKISVHNAHPHWDSVCYNSNNFMYGHVCWFIHGFLWDFRSLNLQVLKI
jgi:hypothetical protein